MKMRNLQFALLTLAGAGLYAIPLKALVVSSVHSDIYPYTATMPLFTAALLYRERKRIYSRVRYDWGLGAALMILALVIRWSRDVSDREANRAEVRGRPSRG